MENFCTFVTKLNNNGHACQPGRILVCGAVPVHVSQLITYNE